MIIWAFYLQIWIYIENLIKVLSLSICSILKNKYQAQTLFQKNDVNSRCIRPLQGILYENLFSRTFPFKIISVMIFRPLHT